MAAGQADEVAFAVADECHPLLPARLAEDALVVDVNPVRVGLDPDALTAQLSGGLARVLDARVDQGAGGGPVEEQPCPAEAEEGQARRVVADDELAAEDVLIEGGRPAAGPCSLGELAGAEGVAGPAMTRIADGLAGLGLAERRRHPSDGRAVEIAATGPGERLMRDAAQRRIDAIVLALEGLAPVDRQRLAVAADLLDHVASHIRQQE